MRAARGGVWWQTAPGRSSRTVSLSPRRRRNNRFHVLRSSSFRRTFIFSSRLLSLLLFTSQHTTFSFFSFSFFFFCAVRSFVQREREKRRGTKRRHTNTDERSLCALRSQFRSRESKTRFIFVFFCLGFLYQKKSLNPKPTRIFFPHRGEKCKILLSVCIFIFRTRKHTRTIIHNKYDFCSHFHNRSRRCRVFCV